MGSSSFLFLVIATIVVAASSSFKGALGSSSVKIDVITHYHEGAIPNAFNIRCTPQDVYGNCAKAVISIQLVKDNSKVMASIQGHDSIVYDRLLQSSVKAEGHIDTDHSKTFLSVTVNEAVAEDSGLYTCKLHYLDDSMQFKVVTASSNVSITNQDTQDIIRHLLSKISFLENLVQFQQTEVSGLKTEMVEQGTRIQSNEVKANQTVRRLQNKLSAQKTEYDAKFEAQKLDIQAQEGRFQEQISALANGMREDMRQLTNPENSTVLFTAIHSVGAIQNGKAFIYDKVVDNIGGGYNGVTGTFTAPREGYYLLHISLCAYTAKWIDIDLKSSKGRILTRLQAYYKDHVDASSASCVVRLEVGEEVTPLVRTATNSFKVWKRETPDSLNTFNGFLIKSL